MKKNKGITLVALIITIVVMLILVAVSVNVIVNSDLIGHAEKTGDAYKNAIAEEEGYNPTLGNGKTLEDYMAEIEKLPEIKEGERATENSNYNGAVIPKGFTVSGISKEQKVDNGLVIYDIPEGTTPDWSNPDSVKTKYNQFVWIPVEVNKATDKETSIAAFRRSNWAENASTGGERTTELSSDFTEPYTDSSGNDYDTSTGIKTQIDELTKSIYKYGGFYIGRYEAGVKPADDGTATPRTSSSDSQTADCVVQQDKYPYNYIKWGKSMSNVSEGAVFVSNKLYNDKEGYGAKSMLCTGACWDSMLDFVKDSKHSVTDSTTWGNYYNSGAYKVYRGSLYSEIDTTLSWNPADKTNGSEVAKNKSVLLTTGATEERNAAKNIYDIAGNVYEWTTESYSSDGRVVRGRPLQRLWFFQSSRRSQLLRSDEQLHQPRVSFSTLRIAVGLQAIN